jgi:DNA-binding MarR family transcriptional regulator
MPGAPVLTWVQVRTIRALYAAGRTTMPQLAETYGVHHATISAIIRGQTWPDPDYLPPAPTRAQLLKEARVIRAQYATGRVSLAAIAEEFGLDKGTVSRIVNNKIRRDPDYTPPAR